MKEYMIFIVITAISLYSSYEYFSYTKEKRLRFSKFWIFSQLITCWILEFILFNKIKSIRHFDSWSNYFIDNNEIIFTIVIAVLSGVFFTAIAILIHTLTYRYIIKELETEYPLSLKDIVNKYKTKSLFTVKGVKVFPFVSIVYALIGLFVVVPILYFIADNFIFVEKDASIAAWSKEDEKINTLNYDKLSDDLKYPLIKIKGTNFDTDAGVKILVLGDSFVWPYGSSNLNYQWWNQLSNELKHRGYNCTVYGVGMPGASTYDELQWLKTTSMMSDLKPDIVIIGYVQNDADLNRTNLPKVKCYGLLSSVINIPFENTFKKFFPNVSNILDIKLSVILGPTEIFSKKIGYQGFTYDLKIIDKEHLPLYNSYAVKPLGDFAASTGIPFILVTTPQSPDIKDFEPRYTPVLPLFEQAGIKVYNSLYDFYNTCSTGVYSENYSINPANDHPGTATTWFYAKYLANKLESDYSEILGKKTLTDKETYHVEINDWLPFSINPQAIRNNDKSAEYIISYPSKKQSSSCLNLPIKTDYVKLNFRYPVNISSVTIEGKKLDSATLYTTVINNELGYDDQTMYSLGNKSGQVCKWTDDSSRRVTSLCIHSEILSGSGDNLTLKINCEEGGVHP